MNVALTTRRWAQLASDPARVALVPPLTPRLPASQRPGAKGSAQDGSASIPTMGREAAGGSSPKGLRSSSPLAGPGNGAAGSSGPVPGVANDIGPCLCVLGPIKLTGAAGPLPPRSARQALELLAWMMWHPDSTAAQMRAGLSVAEGTRRATLSRLRHWLGDDPVGEPYLPLAYSGRLRLHPGVTSDWERLRALVGPDPSLASMGALLAALRMVRGPVFTDALPGRWSWAGRVRADVEALVRSVDEELRSRLGPVSVRGLQQRSDVASPGGYALARASPCGSRRSRDPRSGRTPPLAIL